MNKSGIKYSVYLFFLFVFLLPKSTAAQQDYSFTQLKIEDGLSQSTVICMLQDSKGYLWFGTANGLNRYDGYNFKIFSNDPLDSTSISDNGIVSIMEDSEGYIWLGTVEGVLNRFDRKTGRFKRYFITSSITVTPKADEAYYDFPLPFSRNSNNTITSIKEGKDKSLWIGTWGKGLIKFDWKRNVVTKFSYDPQNPNSLQSNRIKSIFVDDGIIWVGTIGQGIYKLTVNRDDISFVNYKHEGGNKNSLGDNRIVTLYKDREDNLWIGTYGSGLDLLTKENQKQNPPNAKFFHYKHDSKNSNTLSNDIVTAVTEDRTGFLWIGTFGGGVDRLDFKKNIFMNFKNEPAVTSSLSKNDILSIMEDASGSIWIGTHLGKGLNKLQRSTQKFGQINRASANSGGLNDDVVWSIIEDENNIVWIGTYKGGLNKWDRASGKFSYYKNIPGNFSSISDNHIRAIADDGRGNLLIGTYNNGFNIFNKRSGVFKKYLHDPLDTTSLGANQVQYVFVDKEKNYWIGTFGGGLNLLKYASNGVVNFIKYKKNPGDPFSIGDDRIYTIYEDRGGTMWIGTFGGGLNRFDRKNERSISYKNISGDETSLSDNRVMSIYEDSKGNLWIGTYGGGMLKFDKRKEIFTRYNEKNLLTSSVVYGIFEDSKGSLWISTDNGLFKFNTKTEQFTQYDLHDGLQSLEFSGGAYFKSKNGEMFFGGINGFNYFYPDSVRDNYFVPPVVISSVRIFNEEVKGEKDSINVSYDQNFLSIEFASLDYTNPLDNQYAYMLEGFESEWHYVDSRRRIANYTNLSPGEYIFRVRGSNNDGVWNNVGTSIHIIIAPPFWMTWWFVTLTALIISLIIYYLGTMRYRNLFAIEKLKSKLSADLHDNVGAGLTEISILSELTAQEIRLTSQSSSQRLQVISDKARMLIDNMSDIVWMVNPHRDSLYHLILRLKDSYSDFLSSTDISFGTVNIEKFADVKLPMEYKQNLYLIFKEAVNNSIKHSKCKKILLEANINKDGLELSLKDDGIGIDVEKIKYGNGLRNMKNRAKAIGGELEIISAEDGTTIKFAGKIIGLRKFLHLFNK